ncbi:hypothetical protein BJ970_007501 [Saccharopolyspora phatthalungensis]|uniref:Uncharacterized protein n=1 Tax=Saccharopolyspora phatthalungensis TaxID=664693 RepID=A0A840QI19_9PSEU|nr:hypothetical protein [Saccharopolyspora phatthalungensis]
MFASAPLGSTALTLCDESMVRIHFGIAKQAEFRMKFNDVSPDPSCFPTPFLEAFMARTDSVRVAVVGYGYWGSKHMRVLRDCWVTGWARSAT